MKNLVSVLVLTIFLAGCNLAQPSPNLGTKAENIKLNKSTKTEVIQILGHPNSKSSNRYSDVWNYYNNDYSDTVSISFNKKGIVDDVSIRSTGDGSSSFADDITKDATNTLKNEASTAIRDGLRGIFRR